MKENGFKKKRKMEVKCRKRGFVMSVPFLFIV